MGAGVILRLKPAWHMDGCTSRLNAIHSFIHSCRPSHMRDEEREIAMTKK